MSRTEGVRPGAAARPVKKRILLVEDCAPLALLRSRFFAAQGYQALRSANGRDAIERLYRRSFDLVITDSQLPGASGWEVAMAAKRRKVPVILSSGWPVHLTEGEMAERGITVLASKPCTLRRLLACVQAVFAETG